MKIPVIDLIILDKEAIFDYLSENFNAYNKDELKQIGVRLYNMYFTSSQNKEQVLKQILARIGNIQVNNYLCPDENITNYMKLEKVKQFDLKEKLEFIKRFGKYLDEYELNHLIFYETKSSAPSYKELLIDIYLNLIQKTDKTTTS